LRFGSCSPGSHLARPSDRNKKYELTLVKLSFVNNKYNIYTCATLIFNIIFVSYRVCRHQCIQKQSQGGGAFNSGDVCAATKQDSNFVNDLDTMYCTTNNPNILQCVVWWSQCKQSLLSSMPICQWGCVHGNTSLDFALEMTPALVLSAWVNAGT